MNFSPLPYQIRPLGNTRGGNAETFDPATLSPTMWLRADTGYVFQDAAQTTPAVSDADPLGGWNDKGSGNHDASQSTSTKRFALKIAANGINGQSVGRGDGSDDELTASYNGTALTALTVGLVIRPLATETTRGIASWYNLVISTPFILIQRDSTNVRFYVNGNYRFTIAHSSSTAKSYILSWDSTTWKLWVNGAAQSDYTGGGLNNNHAITWHFGNGFNGFSNTDLADFLILESAISSGNATSLATGYYAPRYGL